MPNKVLCVAHSSLFFISRQLLLVKDDYFVSMREEPRLGMIRVSFDEDACTLTLTVNGYPPLVLDISAPEEETKPSFSVSARALICLPTPTKNLVTMHMFCIRTASECLLNGQCKKVRKFSYKAVEVSEEASEWFRNFLKSDKIRLVRILLDQATIDRGLDGTASVAFQDRSSFQVLSKASLDELVSKLPPGTDIRRRNFRPTLFVEGCEAHSEDHWVRYRIAEAEMAFLERTRRCIMTTVDQDTGIRSEKEPLVTLRTYRVDKSKLGLERYDSKPLLGIGSIHVKDGRIKIGDEVWAVVAPKPLL
ncbi:hypothetical protein V5799_033245 [Amblyomma americanum]|uniref:MOSC domain-containing protein n=1 Tax=Amblyomma americanum TaxID=6943 RepID=A0AAQ4DNV4_AMBAM